MVTPEVLGHKLKFVHFLRKGQFTCPKGILRLMWFTGVLTSFMLWVLTGAYEDAIRDTSKSVFDYRWDRPLNGAQVFCPLTIIPLFLVMDQSTCDGYLKLAAGGNLIPTLHWGEINKLYSNLTQEKYIAHQLCICHCNRLHGGPLSRDFIFLFNTSFNSKRKIRDCIILA